VVEPATAGWSAILTRAFACVATAPGPAPSTRHPTRLLPPCANRLRR